MNTISLETLSNGNLRATARERGRTLFWVDGTDAKALVSEALHKGFPHLTLADWLCDWSLVTLNAAAREALGGAK